MEFERKKLTTIEKFSKAILDEQISIGQSEDDFINDIFTAKLEGYFYEHAVDTSKEIRYAKAPSFLDWLLRRKRRFEFEITTKDILLDPPQLPDRTERIHIFK